ncbi:MAG: TIM barrel protein [Thiopseudomonas sp.]
MQLIANLSLLFTELPLLERVEAARLAGFDAVEIQFPYELSPLELHKALQDAGLPLVLINLPAGDLMSGGAGLACQPDRRREFAEALDSALEYALIAKPQQVNVLAGRLLEGQSAEKAFMTLAGNLRETARAFSRLRVQVQAEAINALDMPGFFLTSPQQQLDLLREVSQPNCKAQLDVYHMARQGIDPLQAIALLGDAIGHVQFADNPGRHEPGTGTLDFMAIRQALQSGGYHGGWAAEYRPSSTTSAGLGWMQLPAFQR